MNKLLSFFGLDPKEDGLTDRLFFIFMLVVAFMMPLSIRITTYSIVCATLVLLFSGWMFRSIKRVIHARLNLLFIGWFFLHVAGLLYTENMKYGMLDMQTKLSYLIFPLVFFTSSLRRRQLNRLLLAFCLGCMVASIACLSRAIGWYRYDGQLNHFLYIGYSYLMHPTYFTFYLNLAVLILLTYAWANWKHFDRLGKVVILAALVFMLINIIQLNARTAAAAAFLTITWFLAYHFYKSGERVKGIFILLLFFLFFGSLQYAVFHINSGRFEQLSEVMEKKGEEQKYNSTTLRLELWKNAGELISDNLLLGVGTGDIKEELTRTYEKHQFKEGMQYHYSPHNQYIHSMVILGLIGLLLLLGMLLIPLYMAWREGSWLHLLLAVLVVLNGITESLLEVEKGIIFFAFFSMLFYYKSNVLGLNDRQLLEEKL